jgi:hypothetical protein
MSVIRNISSDCATNCHPYVSRTNWVPTPFPSHHTSERQLAAQFPWWGGQWRTPESPPLPQVYYPQPLLPRGMCEPAWGNEPTPFLLNPNWALTK